MMLTALLFGTLVGVTLGLFGGGGSTVAIPLLAYGIGLDPKEAIATSLLVVGLAAFSGAVKHYREGTADLRAAITFGLFGIIGSAGGAQLARLLPGAAQMTLFALAMITAAGFMLRRDAQPKVPDDPEIRTTTRIVLAALGAGLLTGLVGVGGGFVIVPALMFAVAMPIYRAIGTSLIVIVFNALGGILSYASYITLTGAVWIPFAAGAALATLAGTALGRQIEETRLRSTFAVGLILLGIFTLVRETLSFWAP